MELGYMLKKNSFIFIILGIILIVFFIDITSVTGQQTLSPRFSSQQTPPTTLIGNLWSKIGNDIFNTNSGNVGIGTNAPSEKLDVIGKIKTSETLERDVIMTTLSLKCGWSGGFPSSCNPSSCASGFQDLGTGDFIVTQVSGTFVGNSERWCGSNDLLAVISLKCDWYSSFPSGSCNPPSCPAGFTDAGVGNVINDKEAKYVGYSERFCVQ